MDLVNKYESKASLFFAVKSLHDNNGQKNV